MAQQHPIVIAGGGIGGLTAALALGRKGWSVRLLERAEAFQPLGYGIQLAPNAFHMFDQLGIPSDVLRHCSFPDSVVLRDAVSGDAIARLPLGSAVRSRYGNPYAVIHRADLHAVLLAACADTEGVALETGEEVQGFEQSGEVVRVATAQGVILADALIAADGIWSKLREQVAPGVAPRKLGFLAFRCVRPIEDFPPDLTPNAVVLWAGDGFHLIHYPLRGGRLFNVVAVFQATRPGASDLHTAFAGACPAVRTLLGFVDTARSWEIATIDPFVEWTCGRVALIGDAAHAMVQAMAQGACQSIEDAVSLANCLDRNTADYASGFDRFREERLLRATRVQYMSTYMWELIHVGGALRVLRGDMMSKRGDGDFLEGLSWLYDRPAATAGQQR